MVRLARFVGRAGVVLCLLASATRAQQGPSVGEGLVAADPAPSAVGFHAHNDYQRDPPLFEALDAGAASIEVDVHVVDGRLMVAHDREQVRPGRTLEALYLRPLWERYWRLGGVVRAGQRRALILAIDFKTPADATWSALAPLLDRYQPMLTVWEGGRVRPGAVQVVVSGNRPIAILRAAERRLAAIDGRVGPDLLEGQAPPELMPMVSERWGRLFAWAGEGDPPAGERERLASLAATACRRGVLLRFWASPDTPAAWSLLHEAGVGLINTDRPLALANFLRRVVRADPPGGVIAGPVRVRLTTDDPRATIRYTLDGSSPTADSPANRGAVVVDSAATLRAAAFTPGDRGPAGPVATARFRQAGGKGVEDKE